MSKSEEMNDALKDMIEQIAVVEYQNREEVRNIEKWGIR